MPRMISCIRRTSELPPYSALVRPRSAGVLNGSLLSPALHCAADTLQSFASSLIGSRSCRARRGSTSTMLKTVVRSVA